MRIKLDENLSWHLKGILIELGHQVTTVADEGLLGSCDTEVTATAKS